MIDEYNMAHDNNGHWTIMTLLIHTDYLDHQIIWVFY